jgi:hypothetical protein
MLSGVRACTALKKLKKQTVEIIKIYIFFMVLLLFKDT